MIRPSRFQWGILAALFLHVSGIVSIAGTSLGASSGPLEGRLAQDAPAGEGDPPTDLVELDVDLLEEPAGTELEEAGPAGTEGEPELGLESPGSGLPEGALALSSRSQGAPGAGTTDGLEAAGLDPSERVQLNGASSSEPSSPESGEPGKSGRRLSLEELGVGGDGRRWTGPGPRRRAPGPRRAGRGRRPGPRRSRSSAALARKLEHSLKQGQVAHDRRVGLGAGGPVVSALQLVTRRSAVPARSHAQFLVVADSKGRVTSVTLLGSSGKTRAWNAVALRVKRSLRKKRLRVAQGSRGVALKLEVRSRPQLPSGADPGLAIDFLGLPLKKGRGKKSTRLSVFPPTLMGDLSDIGANEIRMVSARVLSEQVL